MVTNDANAFVLKRTTKDALVHWEESTVKYTIDPSIEENVADGHDATSQAMQSWSGSVGAPDLYAAPLDESSPTSPAFDQKNGVFFMRGGYAPAGRALAITVLTYDNTSGTILDADMIVNGSYAFRVLAPRTSSPSTATQSPTTDGVGHADEGVGDPSTVYDLHHVIAHEFGHSLGMNDELTRTTALMYRYSAPDDPSLRAPASDDIAGLAELYSKKLDAQGNGCDVAPKKPSRSMSHAASLAALSLLLFLVLRARTNRRAKAGFVLAAAASTIAFVPTLSGARGAGTAHAALPKAVALSHASARVLEATTMMEGALFKTNYRLSTTACRMASCPAAGHGSTWGGTIGHVTQDVGGYYAPRAGDAVDVSFEKLPNSFGALSAPLAGRLDAASSIAVRVLTRAEPD
jgi:hypothetical protein